MIGTPFWMSPEVRISSKISQYTRLFKMLGTMNTQIFGLLELRYLSWQKWHLFLFSKVKYLGPTTSL